MKQIATIAAIAIAITASVTTPTMATEPGSWKCERPAVLDPTANAGLEAISTKPSMRNIVIEYMRRWDAQEMRTSCQAFAAGQPAEISCLHGRRDWTAIQNSIPSDLFGMSALNQREHMLSIQAEGDGLKEALDYCRGVGAVRDSGFSLKVGDDS